MADMWGVSETYTDTAGVQHHASPEVRSAIRSALGAPADAHDDPGPSPTGAIVVNQDDDWTLYSGATIRWEDGTSTDVEPGWRPSVSNPTGYHRITIDGQPSRPLIIAPAQCVLPAAFRGWGWAVQLYAARSERSWGIGDLADLRAINTWSAGLGASYTLINPLHAAAPTATPDPSPYFPTSRVWRNPVFLSIEHVPGYAHAPAPVRAVVDHYGSMARALNTSRLIDRGSVWRHKAAALRGLWSVWNHDGVEGRTFTGWRAAEGSSIERFALYCALVDRHGPDARKWPHEIANAHAAGISTKAAELSNEVSFYAWVQWLIEIQLQEANRHLPVMTDLAIGVDRAGADCWVWPSSFCTTMSVGAPPDTFNTQGQNWGLPPFHPWRLRNDGYEPFVRTVRAALRGAGALRMDHVMGLFRLWWIPDGCTPKDGCYVYMPFRDLTGIVALESQRAGVPVVGEDLGTVEPYVREELAKRNILSYRLVQFEPGSAASLPVEAMSAVTTHDLPTAAGFWTGADLIDGILAEVTPNAAGFAEQRSDLAARAGIPVDPDIAELLAPLDPEHANLVAVAAQCGSLDEAALRLDLARERLLDRLNHARAVLISARSSGTETFVKGLYQHLATSPSRLLAATLDDALQVVERPNLPGTTTQRPNWSLALPVGLEAVFDDALVGTVARTLTDRNQGALGPA